MILAQSSETSSSIDLREDFSSAASMGELAYVPPPRAEVRVMTTEGGGQPEMYTAAWYSNRLNAIMESQRVPLHESIRPNGTDKTAQEAQASRLKRAQWESAYAQFVSQEPSTELAAFSAIMLNAGEVKYAQSRVDTLSKKSSLTDEEQRQYWASRETLIENNHRLRALIEAKGDHFTLNQLADWYGKALGNNFAFASGRVAGASAEVAALSALKQTKSYKSAKFASLEDDANGCDITVNGYSLDVKHGRFSTRVESGSDGVHLTFGMPKELIDKYGQPVKGAEEYLEQLLNQHLNDHGHSSRYHGPRMAYSSRDNRQVGAVGLSEPISFKLPHAGIIEAIRHPQSEYAKRAEKLLDEMKAGLAHKPLREVVNDLREEYLDRSDDDIELQRLTQVILRVRQQSEIQDALNADRTDLHSGLLTHEQRVSVGGHYEMLRREACEFNHSVRTLMENNGGEFTRDQLKQWLGKASQGHYSWAEGEITGAVSELAVHAALQGLPELKNVRYGTVDEDLAGFDFVCEWQGALLSIDAKTGHYPPVEEMKAGHHHIEVSVPREVIQGFKVTRRGLAVIRYDVRHALSVEAEMPLRYNY